MIRRLCSLVGFVMLRTTLCAQTPAWQPAPGHLSLDLWPHGAPGAVASPGT